MSCPYDTTHKVSSSAWGYGCLLRDWGYPIDEALEFRDRMEYAVEADDLLLSDDLYLFEGERWLIFDYPQCAWRELAEVIKNT